MPLTTGAGPIFDRSFAMASFVPDTTVPDQARAGSSGPVSLTRKPDLAVVPAEPPAAPPYSTPRSAQAAADDCSPTVDPTRFRTILAHAPSSVAIVTALGPDGPVGMSVGTFVSVSLDPPLVGFFPAKTSTSWPALRAIGRFCINLLAEDQTVISQQFAVSGADKFDGVYWSCSDSGSPRLSGCVAWIECDLEQELDTGDHVLVLGRVHDLDVARDAHALIFHRGSYTSTAAAEA
jgi:flavin reductase (DIM6/NTAB) family NADH-FMN oxidoreductase RutF